MVRPIIITNDGIERIVEQNRDSAFFSDSPLKQIVGYLVGMIINLAVSEPGTLVYNSDLISQHLSTFLQKPMD
jgi:hypothetical protein